MFICSKKGETISSLLKMDGVSNVYLLLLYYNFLISSLLKPTYILDISVSLKSLSAFVASFLIVTLAWACFIRVIFVNLE